jgi:two-component system chemotaxis response regulator CheB
VVIAQHIPPVFSRAFADRLCRQCALEVREAKDGDALAPGLALVAPGDYHMTLHRTPAGYRVSVQTGPKVCYQRPSIDVLFSSVAHAAGANASAALLTGMGADGAQGLLRIRQVQGRTIAQDENTCVVFGMPREAIRLGAAGQTLPLGSIASALLAPMTAAQLQQRRASL